MSLVATRTDVAAAPDRAGLRVGTAGSLLVHLLGFGLALALAPVRPLPAPPQRIIEVDIVAPPRPTPTPTPAQTAARPAAPSSPVGGEAPGEVAPGPAESGTGTGGRHVASEFHAAAILAEPGSAGLRRTLATFADSERVAQLCNIEGIEQIRLAEPAFAPDTIVGYAFADLMQRGLTLTATGGAFRSRRRWYGLSYTCTVGADLASVTAFSFEVGEAIPEAEWDAHSLTAEDAEE